MGKIENNYIELQYSNITRLPVGITSNNVWSGFDMTSASLSEEYSSNFLQEEERGTLCRSELHTYMGHP